MEICESYDNGNLESCYSSIVKLLKKNPTNISCLHNKTLLEFLHANKKRKLNEFENSLDGIASQIDETLKQNDEKNHNLKMGVLYYNLSLSYFLQRKYSSATGILTKLLKLEFFYHGDFEVSHSDVLKSFKYPIFPDLKLSSKILILFIDCLVMVKEYRRAYILCSHFINSSSNQGNAFFSKLDMIQIKIFAIRSLISLGFTSTMEPEIDKLLFNLNGSDQSNCSQAHQLIFLKSRIQMVKRDINSALKCLGSLIPTDKVIDPKDSGVLESALLWNNLGIINSMHQKYTLGISNFSKAMKEFESFTNELYSDENSSFSESLSNYMNQNVSKKPGAINSDKIFKSNISKKTEIAFYNTMNLNCFQTCQHFAVLYNYGLSSLLSKKYGQAFEVFHKLSQVYPKNPRIWYHLGETCLSMNLSQNKSLNKNGLDSNMDLVDFCDGKDRKLFMSFRSSNETRKPWIESSIFSYPSLDLAVLSLKNSLHSLISLSESMVLGADHKNYSTLLMEWAENTSVKLEPSSEILYGFKLLHFFSSALLMLAFASLSIDKQDWDENDESSNEISTFSRCLWLGEMSPPNYRYLAKLYAAEAAFLLKKFSLARNFLKLPNHPYRVNLDDKIISRSRIDDVVSFQCPMYFKSSINFQSDDYIDEIKTKNKLRLDNVNYSQMEVFWLYNQAVVEISTLEVIRVKSILDLIQSKIQLAPFDSRIANFQNKLSHVRLLSNLVMKSSSDLKVDRPELPIASKKLINSNYGYLTMKNRLFR